MIECEPRDLRYIATEFDGWNERHWTVPFVGELASSRRYRSRRGQELSLCLSVVN
jgi:hypothetical protein